VPAAPADDAAPPPFDDSPERRSAWIDERRDLIDRLARVPAFAATEIASAAQDEDPHLRKDAPEEETPPWRRGRAGTAFGRAVHAVLQSIDLATGDGLEGASRAQAAAEGIPSRAREIARAVESALGSAAVREAVASGRYWREVFVGAPAEGATVEGFIDLLYEAPDGLVVVDYKTDRAPTDAELEAAMARYRLQGAAYALALQTTLGRPVVRCVFVFAAPAGPRERAVGDLAGAVEDVRAELRRRMAR
jgi:ATP-dependent helicase/nuclease subunit A